MFYYLIGDADFHLDVDTITVTPKDHTNVAIVFNADAGTNELDESLTWTLVFKPFTLQTFPHGEAVFFRNTINVTILDAKGIVKYYNNNTLDSSLVNFT